MIFAIVGICVPIGLVYAIYRYWKINQDQNQNSSEIVTQSEASEEIHSDIHSHKSNVSHGLFCV